MKVNLFLLLLVGNITCMQELIVIKKGSGNIREYSSYVGFSLDMKSQVLCNLCKDSDEKKDLNEQDLIKAKLAVVYILNGTSLSVPDKSGKTALNYAELNKDKLPNLYKVVCAGKIKQEIEKKAANMKLMTRDKEDLDNAMQILHSFKAK